jgi:3-dehydroquinate dehydratase
MNALGVRDPHLYGTTTAAELDEMLREYAVSRDLGTMSSRSICR